MADRQFAIAMHRVAVCLNSAGRWLPDICQNEYSDAAGATSVDVDVVVVVVVVVDVVVESAIAISIRWTKFSKTADVIAANCAALSC